MGAIFSCSLYFIADHFFYCHCDIVVISYQHVYLRPLHVHTFIRLIMLLERTTLSSYIKVLKVNRAINSIKQIISHETGWIRSVMCDFLSSVLSGGKMVWARIRLVSWRRVHVPWTLNNARLSAQGAATESSTHEWCITGNDWLFCVTPFFKIKSIKWYFDF